MAWECIIPEKTIEDLKADRKSAKRVERYLVSEKALYFEGKYLPLDTVVSVTVHDSTYNPHCCCGRGIPVKKLKIEYGAEKPLLLMVETDKNAQRLKDMIEQVKSEDRG